MAVIGHDHAYLISRSLRSADNPIHGLISGIGFLAFWLAFFAAVWALHVFIAWLF